MQRGFVSLGGKGSANKGTEQALVRRTVMTGAAEPASATEVRGRRAVGEEAATGVVRLGAAK